MKYKRVDLDEMGIDDLLQMVDELTDSRENEEVLYLLVDEWDKRLLCGRM